MKLVYEKRDGMGWITLTDPPHNAITDPVFESQGRLVSFFDDSELTSVIIQGAGRHFSSGADLGSLDALAIDPAQMATALTRAQHLLRTIESAKIPVLALIRGSCLGAGLEIALCCHFRFASANALFGFPETQLGLLPGWGGTVRGPRSANTSAAIELVLSGRLVRADEALDMGLINRRGPTGKIGTMAVEFLRSLTAGKSPELIRAAMEALHNGRRLPIDEALEQEADLFCRLALQRRVANRPT